jgi:chemotaxis protein MotB
MLAAELGKLPNKISIEGHTDSKPYAGARDYGNWELSADRANAARRLMQRDGLGPNQVSQVRGFADQELRKKEEPLDPSNRRITLIVQYIVRDADEDSPDRAAPEGAKPAIGKSEEKGKSEQRARNGLTPRYAAKFCPFLRFVFLSATV